MKDRTECFDDYFSCRENNCKLENDGAPPLPAARRRFARFQMVYVDDLIEDSAWRASSPGPSGERTSSPARRRRRCASWWTRSPTPRRFRRQGSGSRCGPSGCSARPVRRCASRSESSRRSTAAGSSSSPATGGSIPRGPAGARFRPPDAAPRGAPPDAQLLPPPGVGLTTAADWALALYGKSVLKQAKLRQIESLIDDPAGRRQPGRRRRQRRHQLPPAAAWRRVAKRRSRPPRGGFDPAARGERGVSARRRPDAVPRPRVRPGDHRRLPGAHPGRPRLRERARADPHARRDPRRQRPASPAPFPAQSLPPPHRSHRRVARPPPRRATPWKDCARCSGRASRSSAW